MLFAYEPSPQEKQLIVRFLLGVAKLANSNISPADRAMIMAIQKNILDGNDRLEDLQEVSAADFSDISLTSELVHCILQLLLMLNLVDKQTLVKKASYVFAFAKHYKISEPMLRQLRFLVKGQYWKLKLDFKWNSYNGVGIRREFKRHGLFGGLRRYLCMHGWLSIPSLTKKYKALQDYPTDTLGYNLWKYLKDRGFSFPGEKGGFIETVFWHDLVHVLAEYDTDFEGEVEIAGFTAGFLKHNPFFLVFYIFVQLKLGVKIAILALAKTGVFHEPEMAGLFLRAIMRGRKVTFDFTDDWDFAEDLKEKLSVLRERYHIEPKT